MSAISPTSYSDPRHQALAVLLQAKKSGQPWMSGAAISRTLRDDFGVDLHWRTIYTLLIESPGLVSRKKVKGTWQFSAMAAAEELIAPASAVEFIDPQNALRAVLSLHDLLGQLRGIVRVCDPYADRRTIEHLDAVHRDASIRLLTKNVTDQTALRRVLAAAQQNRSLEVRLGENEALHDRYLIDDVMILLIGTSLNGLGKKQSFVVRAGEDVRRVLVPVFDEMWKRSQPF